MRFELTKSEASFIADCIHFYLHKSKYVITADAVMSRNLANKLEKYTDIDPSFTQQIYDKLEEL